MAVALLLAAFLLGGARDAEAVSVTGVEGSYVDIKCVHSNAVGNVKYFCRGACRDVDVVVTSRRPDSTGKYSITDGGNIFHVTVKNLREEDSGTYYCGIERVGVDTYTGVNLRVTKQDSLQDGGTSYHTLAYVGGGLGALLLVLTVVLLIFFKQWNRRTGATSGADQGTSQKQNEAENSAQPGLVYVTVSCKMREAHEDGVLAPEDSTLTPEVTYSAVKRAGEEDMVYCNV